MSSRKKETIITPDIITPPAEDSCEGCSEAEESSCPKSSVLEDDENASC